MKRFSYLFLLFVVVFFQRGHAQLSASDSAYFLNVFTNQRYVNDDIMPGNWYHFPPMTTMYQHYLTLDTNFKFKMADLDSIHYLTVDTLQYDTMVNNSMAQYPNNYPQANQMVYLPFQFLHKTSNAYAFLFPDTLQPRCRYAFMLVPGTGTNESYSIVNGWGYHNQLCQMVANCRTYGDVYTFIKPNEESRAIFWNGKKLNEYIVSYLITQNTRYGINYLIEMIAWIKYLKANYDKVFLFGLSEGGYSSLLCTMYIQPDAALISGGYSIQFDSNAIEKPILKTRFDDLLDTFHQAKVRDVISSSNTQYLFTYGEGDPVETMDPEHDYHYTQTYFSGLSNTSFFYDFNDHTFPPCANIDTFIERILLPPLAHFVVTDSSLTDSLVTRVSFCRSGSYSFDVYRDTTMVQHLTGVHDSALLYLSDSGRYTIRNIVDTSLLAGSCKDTIYCTKQFALADFVGEVKLLGINCTNPFRDQLYIQWPLEFDRINLKVFNQVGQLLSQRQSKTPTETIETSSWPAGIYFLHYQSTSDFGILKLVKKME